MTKIGPQDIGADLAFGADLALSISQCVKHGLNSVYITDKKFQSLGFWASFLSYKKGAPDSLNFQTKRRKKTIRSTCHRETTCVNEEHFT